MTKVVELLPVANTPEKRSWFPKKYEQNALRLVLLVDWGTGDSGQGHVHQECSS